MAQKGHDSRKSKVMVGEQVRRNGPGSHKNFVGRREKTKRKESIIVPLMKKRWSFCKIAVGKEWRRQSHNQAGRSFHFKVLAATRNRHSRSQTSLRKIQKVVSCHVLKRYALLSRDLRWRKFGLVAANYFESFSSFLYYFFLDSLRPLHSIFQFILSTGPRHVSMFYSLSSSPSTRTFSMRFTRVFYLFPYISLTNPPLLGCIKITSKLPSEHCAGRIRMSHTTNIKTSH
jgi:hypothetical protein